MYCIGFCRFFHQCSEDIAVNIGTIAGGAEFTYTFKVVALKIGVQELVVGLESNKVELVSAEAQVGSERETVGVGEGVSV